MSFLFLTSLFSLEMSIYEVVKLFFIVLFVIVFYYKIDRKLVQFELKQTELSNKINTIFEMLKYLNLRK